MQPGDYRLKLVTSIIPLLGILCLCSPLARAQANVDAFFGIGTAMDSSNHQPIDTFGDGNLYSTPRLTGTFGKAGADIMLTPQFGVGGEADFRFSQGNYAGLKYRPTFYDFNGIWTPHFHSTRFVPEIEGGLGAVHLGFYQNQQYCDQFAGCSNSSYYVEGSNHFQVHMSAGLRAYVTDHVFIRPQVDIHWVDNFFQFGSDWVPEYGASIGYSFASRK